MRVVLILLLYSSTCLWGGKIYGKRGNFFIVTGSVPLEGVVFKKGIKRGRYRVVGRTVSESLCRLTEGQMDFDAVSEPAVKTVISSKSPVRSFAGGIKCRESGKNSWISEEPVYLKEMGFDSFSTLRIFLRNREGYGFDILSVDRLKRLKDTGVNRMLLSKSHGELCLAYKEGGGWSSTPVSEETLVKFKDKLGFYLIVNKL